MANCLPCHRTVPDGNPLVLFCTYRPHKVKELILTMVHELERHIIAKQVKWEGGGGGGGD